MPDNVSQNGIKPSCGYPLLFKMIGVLQNFHMKLNNFIPN